MSASEDPEFLLEYRRTPVFLIGLVWLAVVIPLGWGVYQKRGQVSASVPDQHRSQR